MLIQKRSRLLSKLIRFSVVLALPHFTYRLQSWWHIRLWFTASICLCLWLLSLPLPSCSSRFPSLSLSLSTVVKLLSTSFILLLINSAFWLDDLIRKKKLQSNGKGHHHLKFIVSCSSMPHSHKTFVQVLQNHPIRTLNLLVGE
jgi:hypothetical protein